MRPRARRRLVADVADVIAGLALEEWPARRAITDGARLFPTFRSESPGRYAELLELLRLAFR
jgi:hypothetical protein